VIHNGRLRAFAVFDYQLPIAGEEMLQNFERTITMTLRCLLVACIATAGCHGAVYKASKLPAELLVGRVDSTRKLDLSQLARSTTQSDLIYPGDVLDITVATGLEEQSPLSWRLRVSDRGKVDIPLVGPVPVAGLFLKDAEQAIRHESVARRVYRDPLVSVALTSRKTIRVTVVGAVVKPGAYDLPAGDNDLLNALVAAGGLAEEASTIVEIRAAPGAPGQTAGHADGRRTVAENDSVRVDLIQATQGIIPDYRIVDGSIIMVREREPKKIQVIGLVNKSDQFEIPTDRDVRLLDALALAGGRTLQFADKVHVIRQLDNMDEPVVIAASVSEAKRGGASNLRLAPGDIVSVEETPLTFTMGTIRNFVGIGFSSRLPGI